MLERVHHPPDRRLLGSALSCHHPLLGLVPDENAPGHSPFDRPWQGAPDRITITPP
jgi:hypothetical protein